jgi:hypothetical protein
MDAQYRIDMLHRRIRELELWQEKAREDIARLERCIVGLAEPRTEFRDLGEVAAAAGLTHVR